MIRRRVPTVNGCPAVDESAHTRRKGPLRPPSSVAYRLNGVSRQDNSKGEGRMFTELTEELLDLDATTKGYGGALYAAQDPGGGCCASCSTIVLCCCCSHICW